MKLGDFVRAMIVDDDWAVEGVYVKQNNDGTIQVRTPDRQYRCLPEGTVIEVFWSQDTIDFIHKVRLELLKEGKI